MTKMVFTIVLVTCAATAVAMLALAVRSARRPEPPAIPARPAMLTHVRVLSGETEVREVAERAFDRERFIAHAAERRAAHFGELMRTPAVIRSVPLRAVAHDGAAD